MNTPIPPKCLSVEINGVTRSMIRLDQLSFAWDIWKILPSPEQATNWTPPDSTARLRRPNASGQKCENTGVPKPPHQDRCHSRWNKPRVRSVCCCACQEVRGVPWGMSRIRAEYVDRNF